MISAVRASPRWSVLSPLAIPALTTGLLSAGSSVWVGPPLSPSAPSCGSWPMMFEPAGLSVSGTLSGFSTRVKPVVKPAAVGSTPMSVP